jgi:predicted lipid-binding transport protein (Tim44 family)
MPAQQDSGGFGVGSVLGLLLLTGAGFWAFRRYTAAQQAAPTLRAAPAASGASFKADSTPGFGSGAPASDAGVEQIALKTFNELQDANNRGDLPFLRSRLDDLLYQQIEADIQQRGGPGHTQVVSMRAELMDITDQGSRRLVSIRYTGMIVEGPDTPPENLDEVWHFVDENRGAWKLAGIEQV